MIKRYGYYTVEELDAICERNAEVKLKIKTRKRLKFLNLGRATLGIPPTDVLPVQRDGESHDDFCHRMFWVDPNAISEN